MASGQSLAHTMNALFGLSIFYLQIQGLHYQADSGIWVCINNLQRMISAGSSCHAMHTTHMQRRSLTDVQPKSIPSDPEHSSVHMRKGSFKVLRPR